LEGHKLKLKEKLYLITDRKLFSGQCQMYLALETALEAGVKLVQLREKDLSVRELLDVAGWVRELTREYGARLMINDRVDVALSIEADGVHLGQESMPAYAVRKITGDKFLIGISTHGLDEAVKAEEEGADFITLGPVYKTPSKLRYGDPIGIRTLRKVKTRVSIPVFAIGGIKPAKAKEVRDAGADGVAMISAILAARDVKKSTEEFLRFLK
jgi:thiamine-phosphate pyrophosphorylase